jgi:hypothetical protein
MPWGQAGSLPRAATHIALLLALALGALMLTPRVAAAQPVISIQTDDPAGPPLMGLGVQWDPYDTFVPTQAQWDLVFQRLDYMHPGFIRIVEPAYDYFRGYDAAHTPVYRWAAPRVTQLVTMLRYAQTRGIPVVLGDWGNPVIGGDPRIPAGFISQLRSAYGFTTIRYYDPLNEPNYAPNCDFTCWAGVMRTLAAEFEQLGMSSWLQLVGPGNGNSWADTAAAQSLDRTVGLDRDNPIGGDSWMTMTLKSIPGIVGAYDSHRYATIWGVEHGVYEGQMRARREQVNNLDSASKQYFEGEVGLTARQVSPFLAWDRGFSGDRAAWQWLAAMVDPSARASASPFVDSQPHIRQFAYGVWMGDMMVQGINAGLAGASAWDLDDAMHVGGQYGTQNLKQWGFWNSLAGPYGYPASDLQLRPWYYSWSVLSRSFPAGSQPLTVPSTGVPGLRVAAAKVPAAGGYDVSLAIVNDSGTPRSLTVAMPSVSGPLTLQRYDYFASDRPVDSSGFPVPVQVQGGALLSSGVTVQLPSRGLVVLTSMGSGGADLSAGTTIVDELADWSRVFARSTGLRFDHSNPTLFNGDRTRLTRSAKKAQYVIYRLSNMTGFELKAYHAKGLGVRVYGSPDGRTWTPIALGSTNPAPTVGGHGWSFVELLPAAPLARGTSQLKIVLTGARTELSQVLVNGRG